MVIMPASVRPSSQVTGMSRLLEPGRGPMARRTFERGGWASGGWAKGAGGNETGTLITQTYQRADAFLFGRRTYVTVRIKLRQVSDSSASQVRKIRA